MARTVQEVTSRFLGLLSPVELYWDGHIKDGETGGNIMRVEKFKK